MITESAIRQAYARIRKIDHTIPDEVLDYMKDCALEDIKRQEEAKLQKRRDKLAKIRQGGAALKHESKMVVVDGPPKSNTWCGWTHGKPPVPLMWYSGLAGEDLDLPNKNGVSFWCKIDQKASDVYASEREEIALIEKIEKLFAPSHRMQIDSEYSFSVYPNEGESLMDLMKLVTEKMNSIATYKGKIESDAWVAKRTMMQCRKCGEMRENWNANICKECWEEPDEGEADDNICPMCGENEMEYDDQHGICSECNTCPDCGKNQISEGHICDECKNKGGNK
jgi:hypothetical protein